MIRLFTVCFLLMATLLRVSATLYSYTGSSYAVPDGNINGITSQITVNGAGASVGDVNVTINVSGGFNGDLYAYLSYNGTLVTLLNRVGKGTGSFPQSTFGYTDAGFNNVTLDSDAANSIHTYHLVTNPNGAALNGGSWTPDGGNLASFNGTNPNGTWTLFFADLSGGGTSTVTGWSLNITDAVPEPINIALPIFGALLIAVGSVKWIRAARSNNPPAKREP